MKALSYSIGSGLALLAFGTLLAQDNLISRGEQIYLARCEYCHGEGLQKGGTMALQGRYEGAVPAVLDQRTNLTSEYIRAVVRTATNGMAPVRITEVDEQQLDAVIAYLTRNNDD